MTKILKLTDTHYGYDKNSHKAHVRLLELVAHIIKKESVDIVIHAGDWIADNQHQLPRTWKMFREYLGDIPILTVRGNHDLWNSEQFRVPARAKYASLYFGTIQAMLDQQEAWAFEHKIRLLEDQPFVINDTIIFGYDGWYHQRGATNDPEYMHKMVESCPIDLWLANRAYKNLSSILEQVAVCPYQKKILVTHMCPHDVRIDSKMSERMNANPQYMQFITEHFNVCCFGHTHFPVDLSIDGCRFINSGTDYLKNRGYNYPLYYIFEI